MNLFERLFQSDVTPPARRVPWKHFPAIVLFLTSIVPANATDPCQYLNCHESPDNTCTTDTCINGVCYHVSNCPIGQCCNNGTCGTTSCHESPDNPCTDDSCDANGVCQHTNNTASCNDNDPCTVNDKCNGGSCHGTPKNCNDNSNCTNDSCSGGNCKYTSNCTSSDPCNDVICKNDNCDTRPKCDDAKPCTEDSCNSGNCTHLEKCNQPGCMTCSDPCATCDQNNHCQSNGCNTTCCKDDPVKCIARHCENGQCKSTQLCGTGCPDCDDGNQCTTDSCGPDGKCKFVPLCPPNDPPTGNCYENSCSKNPTTGNYECVQKWLCEDYDNCTDDICVGGQCVHKVKCDCPTPGCDDHDPCTENDQCVGGYCQGTPKDCSARNSCETSLGCNSAGNCVYQPVVCPTCQVCDPAMGCVPKNCPGQCCQNGTCVALCSTADCYKPVCPANGICESNCDPDDCETCDGNGTCVVCNGDPCKECVSAQCKIKSQPCDATITDLTLCNAPGASGSLTATITNTGTCEDTFFWKLMVDANGAALGWPNGQRVAHGSVTLDPGQTTSPPIVITITPATNPPGGQADLKLYVCNSRNTLNSPDCSVCPDCSSTCTTKTAKVTLFKVVFTAPNENTYHILGAEIDFVASVEPSGLSPTWSFSYTQGSGSPSTGTSTPFRSTVTTTGTVTVKAEATINGKVCEATRTITVVAPEVVQISFLNDHDLRHWEPDDAGYDIVDPVWIKTLGGSVTCNDPAAYTRSTQTVESKMTADLVLQAAQNLSSAATIKVRGQSGETFGEKQGSVGNWPTASGTFDLLSTPIITDNGAYNSLNVSWEYIVRKLDGSWPSWINAISLGSSSHKIYVTFDQPIIEDALFDLALEKMCIQYSPYWADAESIATHATIGIDLDLCYNPAHGVTVHILNAYSDPNGIVCSQNAILLKYLLNSVGIDAQVRYFYGGTTVGTALMFGLNGTLPAASMQTSAGAHDAAPAQAHYTYHAQTITLIGGIYYDPSYGTVGRASSLHQCTPSGAWLLEDAANYSAAPNCLNLGVLWQDEHGPGTLGTCP